MATTPNAAASIAVRTMPASERINHTLLTLNYGAILALLMPVLIDWTRHETAAVAAFHGVWSMFQSLGLRIPRQRTIATVFAAVPMIGSFGCPYTCDFCIDATIGYQPLPYEQLR